ncbi:MAG: DNA translocase FtsK 4TM domain-containing protein, partial [Desulfobacteraceae bacterium]|nr:DNA translocase FtsK 4TM domain-containing protein [Desulfobacteraceae bacterium]
MKKELIGLFFLFSFILILLSLFSYSATDPSCSNNPFSTPENIDNLFGLVGAHIAGLFVFLFGLGAFWLPCLLLLSALWYFKGKSGKVIICTFIGGFFLILSTGGFFSLFNKEYFLFGTTFSSGGIVAIPFVDFLFKYTNTAGTIIILLFLLIVGFILTTGVSFFTLLLFFKDKLFKFVRVLKHDFNEAARLLKEYYSNWCEKREEKKEEKRKEIEMISFAKENEETTEIVPYIHDS